LTGDPGEADRFRTYAKSQYGQPLGGKDTAKMAALRKTCVSPTFFANLSLSSKLPEIRFFQLGFLDFEHELNFVSHYGRF
jgi:hypothetical protein